MRTIWKEPKPFSKRISFSIILYIYRGLMIIRKALFNSSSFHNGSLLFPPFYPNTLFLAVRHYI